MVDNMTLNDHQRVCNSCRIYIVLLFIFYIISLRTSSECTYLYQYFKE